MRLVLVLAVVVVFFAGCSGEDDSSPESSAPQSTSAAPEIGLDEACPRFRDATHTREFGPASAWEPVRADMEALIDEGDAEVDAVAEPVLAAASAYAKDPLQGSPSLKAAQLWLDARQAIADAC